MNRHQKYLQYANQTSQIIENLINSKLKERIFHDYEAIPILFFFRHCLELYFKGFNYYVNLLGFTTTINEGIHDIIIPFNELLGISIVRTPDNKISDFILKIGNLDPNGQGWRYPESISGSYNQNQEEFAVSIKSDKNNEILNNIKETIQWCINVEGDLDQYVENMQNNQP